MVQRCLKLSSRRTPRQGVSRVRSAMNVEVDFDETEAAVLEPPGWKGKQNDVTREMLDDIAKKKVAKEVMKEMASQK